MGASKPLVVHGWKEATPLEELYCGIRRAYDVAITHCKDYGADYHPAMFYPYRQKRSLLIAKFVKDGATNESPVQNASQGRR